MDTPISNFFVDSSFIMDIKMASYNLMEVKRIRFKRGPATHSFLVSRPQKAGKVSFQDSASTTILRVQY